MTVHAPGTATEGGTRWWTVAVLGVSLACAATLLFLQPDVGRLLLGLAAVAALLVFWFAVGCRTAEDSPTAILFVLVVIAATGALCYAHPTLAVAQCIAFPLVWTQLGRLPGIVVANVALSLAAGAGTAIGVGADQGAITQAAVIEGVSLLFSLGFGLWITGISRQSAVRGQLLDELRRTQDALASVSRDAGAASERERFARDIHDTVAQDLTGLVLLAQQARRELAAGDIEDAAERMRALEDGARAALAETRGLVAATASPALDEQGLVAALERLGERIARETGLTVHVDADPVVALDRDREVVLLRCAQEGVANVRKHAKARTVRVALVESAHLATLTVTDDGCGFDVARTSSGFGLSGMRERLAIVGGSLEVTSGAEGTTLTIGVPA